MKDVSKEVAKVIVKSLNNVLKVEANTASTFISFQPKAPKELQRFRSKK